MDRKQFEHVCNLARIRLDDAEYAEFEGKFNKLLDFVDTIRNHETTASTQPLALIELLEPRRDNSRQFDWNGVECPNFEVPQVIDFEDEA